MLKTGRIAFLTAVFIATSLSYFMIRDSMAYPIHKRIVATVFWVGEMSNIENEYIPNDKSAWDDRWLEHFGGVDDPERRNGFFPADFIPLENPFYFALPYNDFDVNGERKPKALKRIKWARKKKFAENESVCKNRWVRIIKGELEAYAQWEDAGPYGEDDFRYVFGRARPANKRDLPSGIDVSPAVAGYLGIDGSEEVAWQFVEFEDVPDGPWKEIITTSQVFWE